MNLYKKNLYFVCISLFIAVSYILYGYFFRNFITQPDLPKKYLAYKNLEDTVKSAHYEIVSLGDNSLNTNTVYFSPLSETVVFESAKQGFDNDNDEFRLHYKFDNKGKLIDSLKTRRYDSYEIYESYLLSKKNYISWIIDNDTIRHNYIELNPKADWTFERTEEEYNKLSKKASSVYCFKAQMHNYNSDDVGQYFDKALFLIDKKWYALYGKSLFKETVSKPYQKIFAPVYTHKVSKLGSNSWRVNAFYDIVIKNDTLKLKNESWSDRTDMGYYSHPANPAFCILRNSTYFIIRPIN
ncbi:hypothetical protein [Flavobacterium bizetiae]|uniref:hypothetical protein n=1 Tax=Flavobacterium bizetiae TaxID=2704140 RepID=UPI003757FAA5